MDQTKFILAVRNLLENALKYSGKKNIRLLIKKNEFVEFHIQDSGIGISEEDIKKIVKPFYQIDKSVTNIGFGLGLTICKKIIEAHNGKLCIQSEKDKGSTFSIFIPIFND